MLFFNKWAIQKWNYTNTCSLYFQTFLLEPINLIFPNLFANPSKNAFNLIGAAEADLIYLNDFRYSPTNEIVAWNDLLNILDGSKLHTSAPKSTHARDILWVAKQPVVATGPERIKKFHKGTTSLNESETAQMDARWVYVQLTHQIPKINNEIVPCAKCFAMLLLEAN